jgi:hypothetical protein
VKKRLYEPLAALDQERIKADKRQRFWADFRELLYAVAVGWFCLWLAAAL